MCTDVAVDYQQIVNGNIANQIHGFTKDYGRNRENMFSISFREHRKETKENDL